MDAGRAAMRVRGVLLIASAVCFGAACAVRQAGSRELCLLPTADMVRHRESLREMVAAVDSESVVLRRGIGIPTMRPSDVVLVRSSAVCARAARAYRTSDAMPVNPVWVFTLGRSYYAVFHPDMRAGEWQYMAIMTRNFTLVDALAW